jgi:hypothetical protein
MSSASQLGSGAAGWCHGVLRENLSLLSRPRWAVVYVGLGGRSGLPDPGHLAAPAFSAALAGGNQHGLYSLPKVFSDIGITLIPPIPPFRKGGNYKKSLLKSPFLKGDLGGF